MYKKLRLAGLALVFMLSMLLAACGGNGDSEGDSSSSGDSGSSEDSSSSDSNDEATEDSSSGGTKLGKKDIQIPYVAWAGSTSRTPLLKKVLEDVGYNVSIKQVEAGPMWSAVADNANTFTATAWLPATHKSYIDKYGDDVEVYEDANIVDKAPLSLTVPSYMDIDSIKDLKGNKELGEKLDWKITGIDPGAGIMQNTETALKKYNLEKWSVQGSSGAAMTGALDDAISNEEPIVVTGWKPHWMFAEYDLKMLKDPKEVYGGDGDHINMVFNKGFKDRSPAAYKIAKQFAQNYGSDDEKKLMGPIFGEDKEAEKVAEKYVENHQDQVKKWTKGVASE